MGPHVHSLAPNFLTPVVSRPEAGDPVTAPRPVHIEKEIDISNYSVCVIKQRER